MAGYLIAVIAFALSFTFGITGIARARVVLTVGGVLALGWVASLAAQRETDASGNPAVPLWFLAGIVLILYAIWCGGLLLGVRLRRMRRASPG
jgi:branched-subunit amino acid ABC-type transport system permease component